MIPVALSRSELLSQLRESVADSRPPRVAGLGFGIDALDSRLADYGLDGAALHEVALNRKNALFAGSDDGGDHWAVIASLIETCKLNAVDPQAWLADTLTKLANGHSNLRRDELMPWNYTLTVG